jgi:hypothetical protein
MIYMLNFNRLALAYIEGARIISMSGDGTQALVRCDTELQVESISVHTEDEVTTILGLPFWRQPCKDCEI